MLLLTCFFMVSLFSFYSGPTFQDSPSLLSLSTSLWQTALTSKHWFLHTCSLSSMMSCHSRQVSAALHRLSVSSSPKILSLISVGSVSAKFWGGTSQVDMSEALLLEQSNTGEDGSWCMIAQSPTVWNRLENRGINKADVTDYSFITMWTLQDYFLIQQAALWRYKDRGQRTFLFDTPQPEL